MSLICIFSAMLQYLAGFYVAQNWLSQYPYTSNLDLVNLNLRFEVLYNTNMHHLIYMMYPYYYFFRAKLLFWKGELRDCHLPCDLRKTPVLFLYGEDKNIMFHCPTTVALLNEEFLECRRSKAVQVRNAGHWLHLQQEEVCCEEILKFLTNSCVRFNPCKFRNER